MKGGGVVPNAKVGRPVWEGHRQRLRQRMEREGWDALRPHEMVELVLNYAVPRQNLSDVARALVARFGSVGGVFSADREQLLAVEGMTETLSEWVEITGGLMRAYYDIHAESDQRLSCFQEVLAFLKPRLADASVPGLWALYADFDFNLITYSDFGSPDDCWDGATARRLMVEAINSGARYVYLVRFVDAAPPSLPQDDMPRLRALTETLCAADIDLVDCVLANGRDVSSLRLSGRLRVEEGSARMLALREQYEGTGNRD